MSDPSIFVDESGDIGETSRYYLVAFVMHNQDESISETDEAFFGRSANFKKNYLNRIRKKQLG